MAAQFTFVSMKSHFCGAIFSLKMAPQKWAETYRREIRCEMSSNYNCSTASSVGLYILYIYTFPFSMLRFPLLYTTIYSPPIVYPLLSRGCWSNSDKNNVIRSPDSLSSLIQDRKSRESAPASSVAYVELLCHRSTSNKTCSFVLV